MASSEASTAARSNAIAGPPSPPLLLQADVVGGSCCCCCFPFGREEADDASKRSSTQNTSDMSSQQRRFRGFTKHSPLQYTHVQRAFWHALSQRASVAGSLRPVPSAFRITCRGFNLRRRAFEEAPESVAATTSERPPCRRANAARARALAEFGMNDEAAADLDFEPVPGLWTTAERIRSLD